MQLHFFTIAQLDFFGDLVGVIAAVVVSFVAITLVASYYRFQHIVKMAEDTNPEEMGTSTNEILRVQLARYLARCARRGTSFSIALIKANNPNTPVRIDSPLMKEIKRAVRRDDVTCVYDEQTAVLIVESEPEDAFSILGRVTEAISSTDAGPMKSELRVGIASYPGHGLSGKELLHISAEGLKQSTEDTPIRMLEIVSEDEEADLAEDEQGEQNLADSIPSKNDDKRNDPTGRSGRRKNAMLDDLTGVLKPSAVSAYMQRTLSDLRYKKKHAALFCIGVNNMEHISRFHGSEATDDILIGVSKILQDNLRADDPIGRHEKYAFLVLAECSYDEAEIIGKRINMLVQQSEYVSENKKLKTTVTIGVSTYPEHGRNLHHLYTASQKVLDYNRANDIRAYAVFDPKIHDSVPAKPMRNIKSIQAG